MDINLTDIDLASFIEQRKAAEEQHAKEHAWYKRVKELCTSETLALKRTLPAGESKIDHYNNIITEAYDRAMSIGATYFIVAANWFPIFCFAKDFERNFDIAIYGSYTAGTYKGLPIIVSPGLDSFEMICGAEAEVPVYNIESVDVSKFMLIKLED